MRTLVLSASHDGVVKVWDLAPLADARSPRLLAQMRGHSGRVRAVVANAAADRAFSAGNDGAVKVWSLRSYQLRASSPAHRGWVRSLALAAVAADATSSDAAAAPKAQRGERAVIASASSREVKLLDASTLSPLHCHALSPEYKCYCVATTSSALLAGCAFGRRGGAVLGWSLESHAPLLVVAAQPEAPVRSLRAGDERLWIAQTNGVVSSVALDATAPAPAPPDPPPPPPPAEPETRREGGGALVELDTRHGAAVRAIATAAGGVFCGEPEVAGVAAVVGGGAPTLFSGSADKTIMCWSPQLCI